MKLISKQEISLKKLARKYKIRLILLFGSQVNNKIHQMSDLDISVLFEEEKINFKNISQVIMDLGDIFPEQKVDVAIINHADPLFLKKILEKCRLFYGKKSDLVKLKLYSFHSYLDYQKYFDLEEKFCHQFLKTI